jgi:hypothetical protein
MSFQAEPLPERMTEQLSVLMKTFSGERDARGTEEAIDEPGCGSTVTNLK